MTKFNWPRYAMTAPLALAIGLMSQQGHAFVIKADKANLPSLIVNVQSDNPASASELKDAIADIKRRLAEQQEGRQSTGTGELTAELKAARETISELTQGMNRLRGERDNILSEMQRMGDEISRRSDQIAELEREFETATAQSSNEREEMQANLSARIAERDQAQNALSTTTSNLEKSLAEIDQLTASLDQAWSERSAVEQELAQTRTTAAEDLAARDRAIASANAEIDRLSGELSTSSADLEAAASSVTELRIQLDAMTTAAQTTSQSAEETNNALAASTDDLKNERDIRSQAEAELSEQRERVRQVSLEAEGRLKERTSTLTTSIQSAEQRIDELEIEIAGLREVATISVGEVQVLGEQLLTTFKENEELVDALADVRASKEIIESELEAATRDVDFYSAQAALGDNSIAGDNLIAKLQADLRAYEAQITELTEQLIREEQLSTRDGDTATLGDRLIELEDELQTTNARNEELSAELAALKGEAAEPEPEPVQLAAFSEGDIGELLRELNVVNADDGWLMAIPEGIDFAPGSDQLADEANQPLTTVAAMLRYFEGSPIRVVGHTDSYGDPDVNKVLSLARAESVRTYLSSNFGFNADGIATEGFGEEQPIASNDTVSGRRANRRVEVYVLPNN